PQLADKFSAETKQALRNLYINFTEEDAQWIKDKEKITNHDVKAVEYFLKDRFVSLGLSESAEFVHFGLTSQDINNTAVPLSIKDALEEEIIPLMAKVIEKIEALAHEWKDVALLARTHGQPASPTK